MNNNTTTLSKDQINNLLLNAYGFVDVNGVLFTTNTFLLDPCEFKLQSPDHDLLEFSYDNTTFDNGNITFETHDGDTETFTVLAIATDVTELFK